MSSILSITQSTAPVSDLKPEAEIAENMGNMERAVPYNAPAVPVVDQYVHEQAPEPIGLYHITQGEDGTRDISFNAPADTDESGKKKSASEPERDKDKPETVTANTDTVDAEIRKLKEKLESLEQKLIQADNNPQQQEQLQKQISQTESELRIKDTDSYRRQHTRFL